MTVRVTTLKGRDAGAYYVDALPDYYLGPNEPRGRWRGAGAEHLDLSGHVDDRQFLRLMAGHVPNSDRDEPLGRRYNDDSVRGFDATASAPKSVSVLWALADSTTRTEIISAHDAAVCVVVDWIEAHAHTRRRTNGRLDIIDAEGLVAATFRQHTSRSLDPQLHTHIVLANKVLSPDGQWRALDARTLKLDQRTLSAVYHATLRSELTIRLGVEWRPVENGIAEMAHVDDDVLAEFSSRTVDVRQRLDRKLERFTAEFGRSPTPRERWKLEREAVTDSRPSKATPPDMAQLRREWADRALAIGVTRGQLQEETLRRSVARVLDRTAAHAVVERAVASLSDRQSSWRPAEVTREVAASLPADLGGSAATTLNALELLTRFVVEESCVDISRPVRANQPLRRDGRPYSESAADRALTTAAILDQEEQILARSTARLEGVRRDSAAAPARSAVALTGPQTETAAAVARFGALILVVGPAGTGKTTALAPAVEQLRSEGRTVFGAAPSAVAAEVLATETSVDADTLDKLLIEHGLRRRPEHRYDLPAGATVIVDEAGMVSTEQLARLLALADARDWRLVLVGDPMQFSAVGRGGMYELLTDSFGAIELDRVHRFANEWERAASLQLRRGDPSVVDLYEEHGRVHGGPAGQAIALAINAWWSARQRGETVALSAPSNESAAALNREAQRLRSTAGEIDSRGSRLATPAHWLFVGDEVTTRRNDRSARTDQGRMIRNRDRWVIERIHRDGDLVVSGTTGQVRLPAEYVQQHVDLAYAQTSHATQGRTVDRSILVLDGPSDVRGVYAPMTRGRLSNDAYVVCNDDEIAADVLAEAVSRSWIDRPAIVRRAELAAEGSQDAQTLGPNALRSLFAARAAASRSLATQLAVLDRLHRELSRKEEAQRATERRLSEARQRLQAAQRMLAMHDRLFRRGGHEVEIARAKRDVRGLPRTIAEHLSALDIITTEISVIQRRLAEAERLEEVRDALRSKMLGIDAALADDRRLREIVPDGPDQEEPFLARLGPRPSWPEAERLWIDAAGRVAQQQLAFAGLTSDQLEPLAPGRAHSEELIEQARAQLSKAIDAVKVRKHEIQPPRRGRSR
ncbi:MAG: MobF family relaxase [Actinomycetota bacterium]